MYRFKFTLEYDGRPFSGWQKQPDRPSVQHVVEEAIASICQQPAELMVCGRTDAGVHALGQVAHVDLARDWDGFKLMEGLNFHLRERGVSVLAIEPVSSDFHARFSTVQRRYRYRILNRRPHPALDAGRVWHVLAPLDEGRMQEAARSFLGTHDFTSFRAVECQGKTPVKTMDEVVVRRVGEEIWVEVASRSFLYNQVRIMVGTLAKVGRGVWEVDHVKQALEARDRAAAGPTAPAYGLYFMEARYS